MKKNSSFFSTRFFTLSPRKARGFSLIEVLIAMIIFASAIMVINNVWSSNLFRIRKAKMMNEVSLLLQRKMTEIELEYKNQPLTEIPDEDTGDFGTEYPNYRWAFTAQEFEMPDLSSALAGQDGGVDETTRILTKTMTDFINKSIKELKLTIFVNTPRSQKPLEYSITNLLVVYDQEITLPGIGGGGGGGDSN